MLDVSTAVAQTCNLHNNTHAFLQVDRLIDVVGPPTGVEHIRETIVMDKMQYDVASDEYRDVLKERIMDQVERYFMLIVFSLYCNQVCSTRNIIISVGADSTKQSALNRTCVCGNIFLHDNLVIPFL